MVARILRHPGLSAPQRCARNGTRCFYSVSQLVLASGYGTLTEGSLFFQHGLCVCTFAVHLCGAPLRQPPCQEKVGKIHEGYEELQTCFTKQAERLQQAPWVEEGCGQLLYKGRRLHTLHAVCVYFSYVAPAQCQ